MPQTPLDGQAYACTVLIFPLAPCNIWALSICPPLEEDPEINPDHTILHNIPCTHDIVNMMSE